jgi:hypothetical protein
LDTFPFPGHNPREPTPLVEAAGKVFYEARARFMLDTHQGLTKTYNALKDPENTDPAVAELRRLTEAMDRAVLDAYGWTEIVVPPYCPLIDIERVAIQAFEDEVIDRLYVLNAERAREEKRRGLSKEKGKKGQQVRKPAGRTLSEKATSEPTADDPPQKKGAKKAATDPSAKKTTKKTTKKATSKKTSKKSSKKSSKKRVAKAHADLWNKDTK